MKKTITVAEAMRKVGAAEHSILAIAAELEEDTGLRVNGIYMRRGVAAPGEPEPIIRIELEMALP